MYQNRIKELPRLRDENYANIFNVYQDKNERYFYNLLQTVVIPTNLPVNYFDYYNTVYSDTWPVISYKNYQTPNLWWVILKTNNILNPVAPIEPGTQLKILNSRFVSLILQQIST